jgi:hypothetical protein
MDKIIVYLDDAAYAQQQLAPMAGNDRAPSGDATHWVLVACAPHMSRHVSKWVSASARNNWRAAWSAKLFAQLEPQLRERGDRCTTLVARGDLVELTRKLIAQHGTARVLDARRPKFGQELSPVTADQQIGAGDRWQVPGAVAGLGALLVLAAE